ncbi:MAG: exodeoxyribonuclease III [candidate division KSB1 bacterium]|nr:exodeoxyribonuclease III [candidate division KSB1 bacterium]MDZ7304998.1 exodeoxyribonuclease III [candidate division KSB1 bacterium]MDZ7314041.1 exodeoxyribonuclease III [candidate division KSB1 bacterium]
MKFISWNVNGIRAVIKKGLLEFIEQADPEILCLQETKAHPEQVDFVLPDYRQYWNVAKKKGYAGTAIFTKIKPLGVSNDMAIAEHDQEGRVITMEFPDYFLVNVYTPNAKRDLSRLEYRVRWDADFLAYVKNLERKKPVIFCGDLNVAHTEIDLANPKANVGNHGFTPEERAGFSNFIKAGFIDTFREFHKAGGYYTWWSLMNNARQRNIGWRIDYFCISSALRPRLKEAFILPEVTGSDHCPVGMILE